MKEGKDIEAKLHTAVSFSSEYCMISEHRLDDFIHPK